jgi:hypothetical protein
VKSTSHAPERILTYGLYGSGKTHGWATIASYYRRTETPGTFYVISCEHGTVDRLRDGYPVTDDDPGFEQNVISEDVHNWTELTGLTERYLKVAEVGDWIVVEGMQRPWQWVQQLWHETKGEIGPSDDPFAMVEAKEVEWTKVNAVFHRWFSSLLTSPQHLYLTAPEQEIRVAGGWKDKDKVIETYKNIGVKPAGQWEYPYLMHTQLLMRKQGPGNYTVRSVDDHTRDLFEKDTQIIDLVLGYLVPVAGWTL